ncbi:MAG TPA: adenylate cyclase regulatory domain-containing protein [Solirubrobacterales bacterium]|nr:adenylate cyclase regulatory domain-containing protein [Solirubrobacterales bacterium]
MAASEIDFEAEGLLKGLRGRRRRARRELLEELAADGFSLDELRQAVAEDRLALLPVERELAGGGARYSGSQLAELTGVDRAFLDRQWRALGMALPEADEPAYTEADLAAGRRIARLLALGVPEEGMIEVSRVLAIAMSQVAAANRRMVAEAMMRPGDTEAEIAHRFRDAARTLTPMIDEGLAYVFNLHLREQLRHDVLDARQAAAGRLGHTEVTVCFADVVGFTRLGESLPAEELGGVAERLAELAGEVAEPPVRLVKLIGDAAMLVGPARPVLDAALELIDRSGDDEAFPLMRAGLARGQALERAGDFYGHPVNVAARMTEIARPGSVLATGAVKDEAGEERYRWSFARSRRLRGIEGSVDAYRCRRAS